MQESYETEVLEKGTTIFIRRGGLSCQLSQQVLGITPVPKEFVAFTDTIWWLFGH